MSFSDWIISRVIYIMTGSFALVDQIVQIKNDIALLGQSLTNMRILKNNAYLQEDIDLYARIIKDMTNELKIARAKLRVFEGAIMPPF